MTLKQYERLGVAAGLVALLGCGPACGWTLDTRGEALAVDEQTTRELAPAFSLANDDGSFVSLDDLFAGQHDHAPAVLVFYRGHW